MQVTLIEQVELDADGYQAVIASTDEIGTYPVPEPVNQEAKSSFVGRRLSLEEERNKRKERLGRSNSNFREDEEAVESI